MTIEEKAFILLAILRLKQKQTLFTEFWIRKCRLALGEEAPEAGEPLYRSLIEQDFEFLKEDFSNNV